MGMLKEILKKWTFWRTVFATLVGLGLYATYVRFTEGLGAATQLSDEFPWGLWVGFDVLCGVGLAAGGFTIAAAVYIFNAERFRPILRPTILTAFLGYLLVIFALMYDLGRPDRIWHALIMWNPHSVMFEVAWCVMLYTKVLALEFNPIVFEKLGWQKPMQWVKAVTIPLVIVGVILSTLHQSSLGALYLIVPDNLYGLWYSSLLPLYFFISAIAVGCAMTIFESFMSLRAFGKSLEKELVEDLARIMIVALIVYLALKVEELLSSGNLALLWQMRTETYLYYLEMGIGVLLPVALFAVPKLRTNHNVLFISALFVILGFVLNRLNISITGMAASSGVHYFPSWTEISVTMFIVALGFGIFAQAVKYLPVFSDVGAPEKVQTTPMHAGERGLTRKPPEDHSGVVVVDYQGNVWTPES